MSLQLAAEEISEIIDKYDLAGFVTLFEPSHEKKDQAGNRQIVLKLEPSYSCVKISKDNKLRVIRPIIQEVDQTGARQEISDTVNMLTHLGNTAFQVAQGLMAGVNQVIGEFGLKLPAKGPVVGLNGKKLN